MRLGETSGVLRVTDLGKRRAIDVLRGKLAEVAALGYVRTMRTGDTGIGFTLETLLGIDANSSLLPDFEGVEIKAGRSRLPARRRGRSAERVTLFAKTPEWGALRSREGLLDVHGYFDKDGRWSLYMSIYAGRPNPQGWSLRNDSDAAVLWADRHEAAQVGWAHEALEKRVREKHRECVFVTAAVDVREGVEYFWYDELTYCREASLANLLAMTAERAVGVDFAIHRTATGGARDHGFLFRAIKADLPRLFDELGTSVPGLMLALAAHVDERAILAGGPSRGAHESPQIQHRPVRAPGVRATIDHG